MASERASWGTRAGAQIIDGLIIAAGGIFVMIIVSAAGGDSDVSEIALYATIFCASIIYATLLLAREGENNGQTIGKNAMGIRVVRADGKPITLELAAKREAFGKGLLGIIPFYSFVDILWPLGDAENQALHDKVADTFVVPARAVAASGTAAAAGSFAPPTAPVADLPPVAPAPPPAPPQPAPDLGGFTPPVPTEPAPRPEDEVSGPFGPSYD